MTSGFPSTRWTLIRSAAENPAARRAALDELLLGYWTPLYVFLRRKGLDEQAAQDSLQDLLLRLVEKDFLARLDPSKGKLRSFLMASASNHLANEREAASAQKRGAGNLVSLDFSKAERIAADASGPSDAEAAFRQEWAAAVLDRALAALKAEFASGERKGPFDVVTQFFDASKDAPSYKEVAARHAMTIPQLKAFLHRARVRFRELVRDEIAQTVSTPSEVDEELAELLGVLR